MECRIGCAACCTVISISSPIPGMPDGKPAGIPCIHLSPEKACQLFGKSERPQVCIDFKAEPSICGNTNEEAYNNISFLEKS